MPTGQASPKRIAMCCIVGAWKRRIGKKVQLNKYPISRNSVYTGRETGKLMITIKHGDRRQCGCPGMLGREWGRRLNRAEFTSGSYPVENSGSSFKTFFWKLMWCNIKYRRGGAQCFLVYDQKDYIYIYTVEKNDPKLGNKAKRGLSFLRHTGVLFSKPHQGLFI